MGIKISCGAGGHRAYYDLFGESNEANELLTLTGTHLRRGQLTPPFAADEFT